MPHPNRAVPLRLIPRTGRRERSLRGAQPPMVTPLPSRLGAAREHRPSDGRSGGAMHLWHLLINPCGL
jgi:hypothetical protein